MSAAESKAVDGALQDNLLALKKSTTQLNSKVVPKASNTTTRRNKAEVKAADDNILQHDWERGLVTDLWSATDSRYKGEVVRASLPGSSLPLDSTEFRKYVWRLIEKLKAEKTPKHLKDYPDNKNDVLEALQNGRNEIANINNRAQSTKPGSKPSEKLVAFDTHIMKAMQSLKDAEGTGGNVLGFSASAASDENKEKPGGVNDGDQSHNSLLPSASTQPLIKFIYDDESGGYRLANVSLNKREEGAVVAAKLAAASAGAAAAEEETVPVDESEDSNGESFEVISLITCDSLKRNVADLDFEAAYLVIEGRDFDLGSVNQQELLGEGSFGAVVLVESKDNGFAVMKTNSAANLVTRRAAAHEMLFCQLISSQNTASPYIPTFYGWGFSNSLSCIVSTYYPNGTLQEYFTSFGDLKGYARIFQFCVILKGIASGLKFLHKLGIIHGDVKPANIMLRDPIKVALKATGSLVVVSEIYQVALVDLGSFGVPGHELNQGSTMYLPEKNIEHDDGSGLVIKGSMSFEMDLHALGMLVRETITQEDCNKGRWAELGKWDGNKSITLELAPNFAKAHTDLISSKVQLPSASSMADDFSAWTQLAKIRM
mmetsp:Transcript_2100/g.4286  ORF Transcript_2100/g.4286 Transcript_2100/m.4286 type:complete len:600 (+) Transcript_2100:446-2245(+)|eukprot:CAMPEP_0171715464 /NCGR_PEP_ID=MMETSP0991-20121206/18884_1 /TAXON_ID=483369 /ORGANISM="non described non described, Strain CCMP2098" /LENGTH=599 /DNA_ID=CAMNT_0012306357 /DNA_START=491 /DNA_END=2290 /DNA_ORIENTATION=-